MSVNLTTLKTEIVTDPISRGYTGMTDAQIADSLNNTLDRTVNVTSLSPREMQQAVDGDEFVALSASKQRAWLAVLSDFANPNDAVTITQVSAIWVGNTVTIAALSALKTTVGSRSQELGFGTVTPSDVAKAKAL